MQALFVNSYLSLCGLGVTLCELGG